MPQTHRLQSNNEVLGQRPYLQSRSHAPPWARITLVCQRPTDVFVSHTAHFPVSIYCRLKDGKKSPPLVCHRCFRCNLRSLYVDRPLCIPVVLRRAFPRRLPMRHSKFSLCWGSHWHNGAAVARAQNGRPVVIPWNEM